MARNKKKRTPGKGTPAHPKSAEIKEMLDRVRQPKGPEGRKPIADSKKKSGASQTGGGHHLERKGRTKK